MRVYLLPDLLFLLSATCLVIVLLVFRLTLRIVCYVQHANVWLNIGQSGIAAQFSGLFD